MRMYELPDTRGNFGPDGGVFVAETLIHALDELKAAYARYQQDPEFRAAVLGSRPRSRLPFKTLTLL